MAEIIGKTTLGPNFTALPANYKNVWKYDLPRPGFVSKIVFPMSGLGSGVGDQVVRPIIFSDDGAGAPNALLAVGAEVTVADGQVFGDVDLFFNEIVFLNAGTYHWGVHAGSADSTILFSRTIEAVELHHFKGDTYADGTDPTFLSPPAPDGTNATIYVVYEPQEVSLQVGIVSPNLVRNSEIVQRGYVSLPPPTSRTLPVGCYPEPFVFGGGIISQAQPGLVMETSPASTTLSGSASLAEDVNAVPASFASALVASVEESTAAVGSTTLSGIASSAESLSAVPAGLIASGLSQATLSASGVSQSSMSGAASNEWSASAQGTATMSAPAMAAESLSGVGHAQMSAQPSALLFVVQGVGTVTTSSQPSVSYVVSLLASLRQVDFYFFAPIEFSATTALGVVVMDTITVGLSSGLSAISAHVNFSVGTINLSTPLSVSTPSASFATDKYGVLQLLDAGGDVSLVATTIRPGVFADEHSLQVQNVIGGGFRIVVLENLFGDDVEFSPPFLTLADSIAWNASNYYTLVLGSSSNLPAPLTRSFSRSGIDVRAAFQAASVANLDAMADAEATESASAVASLAAQGLALVATAPQSAGASTTMSGGSNTLADTLRTSSANVGLSNPSTAEFSMKKCPNSTFAATSTFRFEARGVAEVTFEAQTAPVLTMSGVGTSTLSGLARAVEAATAPSGSLLASAAGSMGQSVQAIPGLFTASSSMTTRFEAVAVGQFVASGTARGSSTLRAVAANFTAEAQATVTDNVRSTATVTFSAPYWYPIYETDEPNFVLRVRDTRPRLLSAKDGRPSVNVAGNVQSKIVRVRDDAPRIASAKESTKLTDVEGRG